MGPRRSYSPKMSTTTNTAQVVFLVRQSSKPRPAPRPEEETASRSIATQGTLHPDPWTRALSPGDPLTPPALQGNRGPHGQF